MSLNAQSSLAQSTSTLPFPSTSRRTSIYARETPKDARLVEKALKVTPDTLRRLESDWRERRRNRLEESMRRRAEDGWGKFDHEKYEESKRSWESSRRTRSTRDSLSTRSAELDVVASPVITAAKLPSSIKRNPPDPNLTPKPISRLRNQVLPSPSPARSVVRFSEPPEQPETSAPSAKHKSIDVQPLPPGSYQTTVPSPFFSSSISNTFISCTLVIHPPKSNRSASLLLGDTERLHISINTFTHVQRSSGGKWMRNALSVEEWDDWGKSNQKRWQGFERVVQRVKSRVDSVSHSV